MRKIITNHLKQKLPFLSFLLMFGLIIFYINLKMPLVGEDYTLQPWGFNQTPAKLEAKINAVVRAVTYSATHWSPRIGEGLATATAAFPKVIFNILNTVLIVWLIIVLFALAFGRFPNPVSSWDVKSLIIFSLLILTLFPLLGQVFFWKAGACNHLWGVLLTLTFSLPFRLYEPLKKFITQPVVFPLFVVFGFFAGLTVENTSAIVFAFLMIYYMVCRVKKKIETKYVFPMLANALGVSFLLFSKGTLFRRNYYQSFGYDGNLTGVNLYIDRFLRVNEDLIATTWPIIVTFSICLFAYIVCIKVSSKHTNTSFRFDRIQNLWIFSMVGISYVSVLALLSIAYQSDQRRAFTYFWLTVIMALGFLIIEILKLLSKNVVTVLFFGFFIIYSVQVGNILTYYSQLQKEANFRIEALTQAALTNKESVVVPKFLTMDSRIIETREILDDMGVRLASYYGLKEVIILDKGDQK